MPSRFLITTSDERTWKYDRPVLFLGEWCQLYDRESQWSRLNYITAEPYGIDNDKKSIDYEYVYNQVEILLVEVSEALNKYHDTKHSIRYWRIILGQWLQRYVSVVFNRWYSIAQAIENYDILSTSVLNPDKYHLATQDSYAFIWACNDDVWNHMLYAKILQYIKLVDIEVLENNCVDENYFIWSKGDTESKILKNFFRDMTRCFLQKFSRSKDAVIIQSYLPKKEVIKLQLKLLQVPQSWSTPSPKNVDINNDIRKKLGLRLDKYSGFEHFVRKIVFDVIPVCYLEGYQSLLSQVDNLSWPTKPKFIFTANSFDTDEVFKVWTAHKVEQGFKYYTGQHGNNYGTLKYCSSETELVKTSDKFITWGWSNDKLNVVPAFNFKYPMPAKNVLDLEGDLLLIEVCSPHRLSPWDCYHEFSIYLNDQFRFVELLPESLKSSLTIRLHSEIKLFKRSENKIWEEKFPNVKLDYGGNDINKLLSRARLIVHSYDSTGILETLSMNRPTVCFWHEGLSHLNMNAIPYYQQLKDAGILAETPEHAVELIQSYWDDVSTWWESDNVQTARQLFCENFSRSEKQPATFLNKIFQCETGI